MCQCLDATPLLFGDGVCQQNELFTLDQLGIASIDLNRAELDKQDNGNIILGGSTFTRADGSKGDIAEVSFHYDGTSKANVALLSQTQQLVSAMASFAPSAAGQITLSQAAHDQQQPVLAASLSKAA